MMARFNSANASYGESYLLVTILAAVLGGVDPFGGFGKVGGLMMALILLQVISSAFNLLEFQPVPDPGDLGRADHRRDGARRVARRARRLAPLERRRANGRSRPRLWAARSAIGFRVVEQSSRLKGGRPGANARPRRFPLWSKFDRRRLKFETTLRSRRTEGDILRCGGCTFENRDGRKFCASCGAALPSPCRNCGYVNDDADRFCGGCGRPLADNRGEAAKPAVAEGPEGDRRPVTILFCDLVGYTQSFLEAGPGRNPCFARAFFHARRRDRRAFRRRDRQTYRRRRHGAVRRAARAWRRLRSAPSAPRWKSRPPFQNLGRELAISAGGACRRRDGRSRRKFGRQPASSRLYRHRRGRQCGGAASRTGRRRRDARLGRRLPGDQPCLRPMSSLGAVALKGLDHPVEAWRLIGTKSAAAETQALVGRRSELGQCRAALDACVDGNVRRRHPDPRRGRHRQDAADGGIAIDRRGGGNDAARRPHSRFRNRARPWRGPHDRRRTARA